jgi:phage-related protein
MPKVEVVLFKENNGTVPLLDWLGGLIPKARAKCIARIIRLKQRGHELRRPEADYLRDEIYELRIGLRHVNYRILYFFHGRTATVLSHGLTKEGRVPSVEIDKAIERKNRFKADPEAHVYRLELE